LNQAMLMLADQPDAIFIGQNVEYPGNVMYKHLEGVSAEQRLELPVFEDLQMGMSIGLSLQGFLPISIYPRFDFLLLAANQLINHLDKLGVCSQGQWKPKVIIRTKVGGKSPLDAGPQHTQDHTDAFASMLTNVTVYRIEDPDTILSTYQSVIRNPESALVIEALS
jgi:pyruvate/2-oxoglutarate/acetoin dehydrogenase E1 component